MKPKYIVYECENCGALFYRDVLNVLRDDGAHCDVEVALAQDPADGLVEEFPMCECLGGSPAPITNLVR